MWTYLGPSCPDHPSSEELSAAEVDAQIHKILDLGVNLTPSSSPVPLWRGIASVRVNTLGPILVAFAILSFHYAHDLAQGLGAVHEELRDADPPGDAVGHKVRHASSEETQVWEETEREISALPDG
jgi:hypothetical protein